MGHISVYLQVSLDGCFAGPHGEIDWFKNNPDPEFEEFSLERARGESVLLFGRTTYEMMSSAWPSDEAHEDQPQMADVMAKSPKIVFSRSLRNVEESPRWQKVEIRRDLDPDSLRADPRLHDARERLDRAAADPARCCRRVQLRREPDRARSGQERARGRRHDASRAVRLAVVQERTRLADLPPSLTAVV